MPRTKLPSGAYLVFGPGVPPQVHLLTLEQREAMYTAERIARDSSNPDLYLSQVRRQTFGADVAHIVPAWSLEAMELIATNYTGEHETAVRGLAAAIAMGRTFGPEGRDSPPKGPEGGDKVTQGKGPKRPRGGAGALPDMFASLKSPA